MACKLKTVPNTTDLEAPTGQSVTLTTKNHIGNVLIAKAEYGGVQLVPANQAVASVQFTVAAGRKTMKMVFVFDASTTGRGELREDCGDNSSQFLRDLAGHEPLQVFRVTGK